MPKPYLERHDGDLISASDWNEVQVRAREEIAAVDAKITGIDPSSDVTVRNLTATNLTVTGTAKLGLAGVQTFEARLKEGDHGGYTGNGGSGTAHGYQNPAFGVGLPLITTGSLAILPSPTLTVKVEKNSLLLLSATFSIYPTAQAIYYYAYATRNADQTSVTYPDVFQLVIGDGSRKAPVRSVGLTAEDQPTLATLDKWLTTHQDQLKTGSWPVRGLVSYTPTGYLTPVQIAEPLEVTAGTWKVQLCAQVQSAWLYNIALRAVAIPLGETK